jgi:uncharacterized protein (UPF0333 family)
MKDKDYRKQILIELGITILVVILFASVAYYQIKN